VEAGAAERASSTAAEDLARVVAGLAAGEPRPGQAAMATAVEAAISGRRHLLVQAGTGTGKSLGYLVPAVRSGQRVVVVTATKALQDQLVRHDLPLVARHLDRPVRAALLKGRSNYLCRAALEDAVAGATGRLLSDGPAPAGLEAVAAWAATATGGDRDELPEAVPDRTWAAVSVAAGECPGASRCPHGETCFAERARDEASRADVVVVNAHLYAQHLASDGAVLPDHEVVVIDEAHAFEDVAVDGLGTAVGRTRFAAAARAVAALFTPEDDTASRLDAAGDRVDAVLAPLVGRRADVAAGDLAVALAGAAEVVAAATARVRPLPAGGDAAARRERALQVCDRLAVDLRDLAEPTDGRVAWVEAAPAPTLRVAPVDVAGELAERLFSRTTTVLTSATLTVGGSFAPLAERLGVDLAEAEALDVGSPFHYEDQALLYCAAHLPDPRSAGYEAAMLDELEALIRAAGGRTLALFTSRRAMDAAAERLVDRLPWRVLVQGRLPQPVLRQEFRADESSVLLATLGFWQGFDAPGPTCSLVTIDRLPFSRPDDPVAEARRAAATRARRNAFAAVDLPRAAILLAQGAGRLVRTSSDRGVVAVLDRRLATASYRWTLVRSLPPMARTKDPAVASARLAELAAASAAAA
jgi:ATP-dependent DNA helicase DinG